MTGSHDILSLRPYCGRFFGFPKKVPKIYFPVRRFFWWYPSYIPRQKERGIFRWRKNYLRKGIVLLRDVVDLWFLPFAPDAVPAPCFKTASHRSRMDLRLLRCRIPSGRSFNYQRAFERKRPHFLYSIFSRLYRKSIRNYSMNELSVAMDELLTYL